MNEKEINILSILKEKIFPHLIEAVEASLLDLTTNQKEALLDSLIHSIKDNHDLTAAQLTSKMQGLYGETMKSFIGVAALTFIFNAQEYCAEG